MLSRFVDIRPGEGKRALLACGSLLLVIASYTMVKSVRDALFLSKFGITQLSFIAIGLALATGFIISIYVRSTAGMPRHKVIGGTNAVIVASLVLIWFGLLSGSEMLLKLLPWVLYIWSSVFGVFLVMQFWLLAQDLFDPREAKRLFGVVGAGAILGGVSGGFLSRFLAGYLGASNMLLVASGMLVAEVLLVAMVWPLRRKEEPLPSSTKKNQKKKPTGGLGTIKESRVVRLLACALLLATMATTLLDWQFKGIVKDVLSREPDPSAAMAGYFGSLYAGLSVASFLVQTLFTSGILRRFGVGVGLMLLPVSLLGGSALILLHTVMPFAGARLFSASAAKVAEGGLRFSVDKASMELMWLPVPPDVKERGKSFVDTVVDRLGTGLTGFIWLGLAAVGLDAPNKIHFISIAVAGLVVVWLLILLGARGAYLGALREAISERKLDLDDSSLNLVDPGAVAPLRQMLDSGEAREALFALHMLEHYQGPLQELEQALNHDDPTVCREALLFVTRRGDGGHRAAAARCLTHDDDRVREAAVFYLHSTAPTGSDPLLQRLADGEQVEPLIIDVIKLGIPAAAMAAAHRIEKELAHRSDDPRLAARLLSLIRILGGAPPDMAAALLAAPLRDEDLQVARTAIRAAGRARAVRLIPELAELLSETPLRQSAAGALQDLGAEAAEHLVELLQRSAPEKLPHAARQAVIRLLGSTGSEQAVSQLLELLDGEDFDTSHGALRALSRLAKKNKMILSPQQRGLVRQALDQELGTLQRDLLFLERGSWADLREVDPPGDLLGSALAQRADQRMERIFRMLALGRKDDSSFGVDDMTAASASVRSPLKSVRASSIEFLDNVLPNELSAPIMPLLETAGVKRFVAAARQQGLQRTGRLELMRVLLTEPDSVLQAVAAWTAGGEGLTELRGTLAPMLDVADPRVIQVMQDAVSKLDSPDKEPDKMGLNAIEKALTLQKVDVLKRASTDDLVHIAQIATEEELEAGAEIYSEGDAPDALFVITSGKVRLHRADEEIAVLGEGEAFGSWALVDESPRVASATTVDPTTLLRVSREEFMELLADRVDIVQAVFKAMVERLRNLAALTKE